MKEETQNDKQLTEAWRTPYVTGKIQIKLEMSFHFTSVLVTILHNICVCVCVCVRGDLLEYLKWSEAG
jgi:hypothetical protein